MSLHEAIRLGDVEKVREILDSGNIDLEQLEVDLSEDNVVNTCFTPLALAYAYNHETIINLLVAYGAEFEYFHTPGRYHSGDTETRHLEDGSILISHWVDLDRPNRTCFASMYENTANWVKKVRNQKAVIALSTRRKKHRLNRFEPNLDRYIKTKVLHYLGV